MSLLRKSIFLIPLFAVVHQQNQGSRSEQEVSTSSKTKPAREEQIIHAPARTSAAQTHTVMKQLRAAMTARDEDIYDFPDEEEAR